MFCRIARTTVCVLLISFLLVIPRSAGADPFDDLKNWWNGLFNDEQAANAIKPRILPPADGKSLGHTRFYIVKMNCSKSPNTGALISKGLVVKNETFVAHTLWLSSAAGDGSVPTNPVKLVNAF